MTPTTAADIFRNVVKSHRDIKLKLIPANKENTSGWGMRAVVLIQTCSFRSGWVGTQSEMRADLSSPPGPQQTRTTKVLTYPRVCIGGLVLLFLQGSRAEQQDKTHFHSRAHTHTHHHRPSTNEIQISCHTLALRIYWLLLNEIYCRLYAIVLINAWSWWLESVYSWRLLWNAPPTPTSQRVEQAAHIEFLLGETFIRNIFCFFNPPWIAVRINQRGLETYPFAVTA